MKKRKSAVFDVVGYIVLFLIVLIVVLPLFWLIVSSFKSDADVIKWPPHFFPSEWVATQYRYVMKAIPVLDMLKNTVIFAGCVTVISLFFDSLAAYAFSRMQFRGRKVIFGIILLTMMIPFQVIMIPLYLEEFNLKILNTYLGLILPRTASAYGIYMLTSFFSGVPKSLDEAARIDGASSFALFRKIKLPLLMPTVLMASIVTMIGSMRVFDTIKLMTEGGPEGSTMVLVYYVYYQGFRAYKSGYASAIAVILFLIMLGMTLLQWLARRKVSHYEE